MEKRHIPKGDSPGDLPAGHRVDFLGYPVTDVPIEVLVQEIEQRLVRHQSTHVLNFNPYHFLLARNHPEFRRVCETSDIIFADGVGIKLASSWSSFRIRNRYTGSDVMAQLCALAGRKGYSIFLFGGQDGIAMQCAQRLSRQVPGLRIAGTMEPPYSEDIEAWDNGSIVRTIKRTAPDILFVALGAPKQEQWIDRYRSKLKVPIMMGVGGSFDILGGRFARAPQWMRVAGLEWLYRLGVEPRRLSRRYLLGIPQFIAVVLAMRLGIRGIKSSP